MTTEQTNTDAGGTPSNSGSNNAAARPAMPTQNAGNPENNAGNPRAAGHSPAMQSRETAATPAEAMVKFADGSEHSEADLRAAIGEHAEAASRKATLPANADAYAIKLPDDFVPPENVRFEFNAQDPALKAFRDVAAKHGVSQELFSDALAVFASTRMGEAINQSKLRDVNMRALGATGPQRIEAVATWLGAHVPGDEGKATANFIRQFPSAPIVKTMERLMRAFSNQGGADFDQRGRATEEPAGKIPGYDSMNFTQRRVAQMRQALGGSSGKER